MSYNIKLKNLQENRKNYRNKKLEKRETFFD